MEQPSIESWTMTDADIGAMNWHDVPVHQMLHVTEQREVLFDIDYILKWVEPSRGESHYQNWSAPATLVFHNVCRLVADIEPVADQVFLSLGPTDEPIENDIAIPSGAAAVGWWAIKCPVGYWRLLTSGFTLYLRRAAVLTTGGRIDLSQRGSPSFLRGRDDAAA